MCRRHRTGSGSHVRAGHAIDIRTHVRVAPALLHAAEACPCSRGAHDGNRSIQRMDNDKADCDAQQPDRDAARTAKRGFGRRRKGCPDQQIKTASCSKFSRERGQMAQELQDGGAGGSAAIRRRPAACRGSVHRGWMNIKSAVTGKDDAEHHRGGGAGRGHREEGLRERARAGTAGDRSARSCEQQAVQRARSPRPGPRAWRGATAR